MPTLTDDARMRRRILNVGRVLALNNPPALWGRALSFALQITGLLLVTAPAAAAPAAPQFTSTAAAVGAAYAYA
jgi:hypothetical protein